MAREAFYFDFGPNINIRYYPEPAIFFVLNTIVSNPFQSKSWTLNRSSR